MSTRISKLIVVALAGTMLATAPSFAAPPMGGSGPSGGPGGQPNCMDPSVHDPACPPTRGRHRHDNGPGNAGSGNGPNGGSNSTNGAGPMGNAPSNKGPTDHNGANSHNGQQDRNGNWNGPGKGPGNFNGPGRGPHGHPPFHNWMRSFHFPSFARPFFDVRPGVVVPHSYRLRRVPPEILWYYPQYAGFLYFVGRHGEIVIVSPRSLRIIAVLD